MKNLCYVEFRVRSTEQLSRLSRVVEALREAKLNDTFPVDEEWRAYFTQDEIDTFWWPTVEERKDWERRWFSTPVRKRFNDPSLKTPWDFGSMIEAIRYGEYSIVGVRSGNKAKAYLEYDPTAYPYGGTGALSALVLAFGHELIGYEDGSGFTELS
jgi:hypothetical protein